MIDCTNYVITHKPYPVVQDDMYKKMCVGGYCDDICASEREGENIAEYNDRLNELTGLYWIWKNTESEYVGLSHYRRFFQDCGRLNADRIEEIMKDHDIILSSIELPWTIFHNIGMASGFDLAAAGYEAFMDSIRKHQPEYVDAFEDVMNGKRMYRCNMFVTSREIMDRFCSWLFSFLTEATDKVDVRNLGFYERRVCGYFGETMWTVWMEKQGLRVFNMPIGG